MRFLVFTCIQQLKFIPAINLKFNIKNLALSILGLFP